jgi:hypothetical protein
MKHANNLDSVTSFIRESNKIEGILREPTQDEIDEYNRFIKLDRVTIKDLEEFVKVYQPDARLRCVYGLNVRVGNYYPPFGGPEIIEKLEEVLKIKDAFTAHVAYEQLHPFTDGNGRSGRMLWAYLMDDMHSLDFLHTFYYQTLNHLSKKSAFN